MGSRILSPDDPMYPPALATAFAARAPPPTLYVRGALPSAEGIAVVGTRKASEAARALTGVIVKDLVKAGFVIWSGGALGIDAAAHEAALSVGGRTVVVAGGGLDRPYPREHVPLFARVLDSGGALVARVPDDAAPSPVRFIQRNEVLAALTVATVVMEAGYMSGARSTAAFARRFGRHLCVVPHAPWEPNGEGCALELVRGAVAVTSAAHVLEALGSTPAPRVGRKHTARGSSGADVARGQAALALSEAAGSGRAHRGGEAGPATPVDLDPAEIAALAVLAREPRPRHLEEVCVEGKLGAGQGAAALFMLTLRGLVVEGPAGFFRQPGPPSAGR